MAKFAVQGAAADWIAINILKQQLPDLKGGLKLGQLSSRRILSLTCSLMLV